jgi:hypothetical protein
MIDGLTAVKITDAFILDLLRRDACVVLLLALGTEPFASRRNLVSARAEVLTFR